MFNLSFKPLIIFSINSKSTLPEMQETAYTLHRTAYSSNPRSRGMSSTWNVMGVPPNYRSPSEQKKWQPTRLW